jgi:hypothetical protein
VFDRATGLRPECFAVAGLPAAWPAPSE